MQDAADAVDRLFPLSLASEGSCRIGGNLSTNAGGLNVIAYGNARDLCLGLEVVLADGRIWNGLKRLRKDNTGYDLRDLFIGAEGTLGIITAAVLKLFPRPKQLGDGLHRRALAAGRRRPPVAHAKEMSGNRVVGFELIADIALQFAIRHAGRPPSALRALALVCARRTGRSGARRHDGASRVRHGARPRHRCGPGPVGSQRAEFWSARELISESQKPEGGSIKHDISVPVSQGAAVP